MLKGPEKEASSYGACLFSRCEDEVLSFPSAAAEVLALSSQQCFSCIQGSPFLYIEQRSLKATVLVFVCSITKCYIVSGLKQHIYFLTLL